MPVAIRDAIERLFWTFVAAFIGALVGSSLLPNLDVSALQSAALAGLGAVANALLLIARWRLDVLPTPGAAVAEEAATEAYRHIEAP